MASMAAKSISECVEEQQQGPPTAVVQSIQGYDFAEQPSEDFFCPVTFELLTDPHLTVCCGSHLSQDAVIRLQGDSKPCPMCKHEQLTTVLDKNMQRKVSALKVQCHHKQSGCEWVGEISYLNGHLQSCPKRPWSCCYCQFESTYDIGMKEHVNNCTKYPIVCPNSCGVEKVLRCDLDAHLEVCPLQIVACLYAEFGCDIKVPRKDLSRHLDEEQQQHQFSATLLNVQLTREVLSAQKTEMVRESLAKEVDQVRRELERQLAEKELIITEQDKKITEKEKQLQDKDREIVVKDKELVDKDKELVDKDEQISRLKRQVANEVEINGKQEARKLLDEGFTPCSFSVTNICKRFDSRECTVQNYTLRFNAIASHCRTYFCVGLIVSGWVCNAKVHWPIKCTIHLWIVDENGTRLDYQLGRAQFQEPYSRQGSYQDNIIRIPMRKLRHTDHEMVKRPVAVAPSIYDDEDYYKDVSLEFQTYVKIENV